MPSIFDLMPASVWPVQAFLPPDEQARTLVALQSQLASRDPPWLVPRLDPTPPDPTQPSTLSSSSAPSWTAPAGLSAQPFNSPTTTVDAPPYGESSASAWDRAMRQVLAPQGNTTRAPDVGDSAASERMLADAKRAYDFVRWAFGPPSVPRVAPTSVSMPFEAPQYGGAGPANVVAASADTMQPPLRPPQADDANIPPQARANADQEPELGATYGNPNLARQGRRARKIAGDRPSSADLFNSIPRGILLGLANTASAGGQAAQIEMQQPVDVPSGDEATDIIERNITGPLPKPQGPAGQVGKTIGEFLGNPMSYIGPGGLAAKVLQAIVGGLGSEVAGQLTQGTWAEPLARIGGGMVRPGAIASALRRAPAATEAAAANAARDGTRRPATAPAGAVQTPPVEPSADAAGLPHVDPATAPLVPYDAESALAAAQRGGIDVNRLFNRAREIHSALESSWAQGRRTTAVLLTDRATIIGGGVKDLERRQTKLLRAGEIPAKLPGAHAEETVIRDAIQRGHRPRAIAASWPFCPKCRKFIELMGGIFTSDTTAVFPPF